MKRFVTTTLAGALIAGFAWAAAPAADAHASADVKWYGQAAFRIKTPGGKVIVIDPFITKNPKTPADDKDLAKLGFRAMIAGSIAAFMTATVAGILV